jgi:hypothetical protein
MRIMTAAAIGESAMIDKKGNSINSLPLFEIRDWRLEID